MKYLLAGLIWLYRRISRLTPPVCRFYPTCSQYAYTAILRFGALRGTYLAVRRLLRCHPWNPGGIDPVPEWISYPVQQHRLHRQRPSRHTLLNPRQKG